jgi:ribonuclease-3
MSPDSVVEDVEDLVVIFRTQSDVEASIVRGLLEAHHVPSVLASAVPRSVFPLNVTSLAEVRLSVRASDADEARRIIESHRTEVPNGQLVRLRIEFEGLQRAIGYRFSDRDLLEHAMTHASRANEDLTGGLADNESLEFLGDAVLGFAIADLLFREFPDLDEGQKSKIKASLVSSTTLASQAERLELGAHLLLGRGEERSGGRHKQALLADAYEALIAAMYLDGGVEQVRAFIAREFGPLLDEVRRHGLADRDHKSALQEYLQAHDEPLPEYRLTGTTGPDHSPVFEVEVSVRGDPVAEGRGPNKKEAEQEAARLALARLTESSQSR